MDIFLLWPAWCWAIVKLSVHHMLPKKEEMSAPNPCDLSGV